MLKATLSLWANTSRVWWGLEGRGRKCCPAPGSTSARKKQIVMSWRISQRSHKAPSGILWHSTLISFCSSTNPSPEGWSGSLFARTGGALCEPWHLPCPGALRERCSQHPDRHLSTRRSCQGCHLGTSQGRGEEPPAGWAAPSPPWAQHWRCLTWICHQRSLCTAGTAGDKASSSNVVMVLGKFHKYQKHLSVQCGMKGERS